MGQWLFDLTELLRGTQLVEFSLWVSDWPLALWLQSNFLAIPGFQTLHILAIAVLFSSVLMLNLRIWGVTGKGTDMVLYGVIETLDATKAAKLEAARRKAEPNWAP